MRCWISRIVTTHPLSRNIPSPDRRRDDRNRSCSNPPPCSGPGEEGQAGLRPGCSKLPTLRAIWRRDSRRRWPHAQRIWRDAFVELGGQRWVGAHVGRREFFRRQRLMYLGSNVGKLLLRDAILNSIAWRSD